MFWYGFVFGLLCLFCLIMQYIALRKFVKYYDIFNELKNYRKSNPLWGLWL